jgi:hypothetical protein
MSVKFSTGVLAVWTDVVAEHETEFNSWYSEEHLPERLAIPGFRYVRRYAGLGSPKYLTFYETQRADVLASAPYLERLANPSDWTRRVMPWFVATRRCACRVLASVGQGVGGVAQSVTFSMWQAEEALPAWLSGKALPEAASHLGCVRVQLWHCDAAITGQPNPEAALRPQRDSAADWMILIEAVCEPALGEILPALEKTLHANGVTQVLSQGPYQLLTYLRKE